MSQRSWPWDSGAGANVLESDWGLMARWWLMPGAILSYLGGLQVVGDSSGKQVKVQTGAAWAYGAFYSNDAEYILGPFPDNASGNPRIDRVVVRFDWTTNTAVITHLAGTPAASPSPPSLAASPGTVWDLELAQVAIATGYTTIASGDVTDRRYDATPRSPLIGYATGSTADPTTTSTTNVALPDMTVNVVSGGGVLLVWFYTMWSIDAAGVQSRFYLSLDGVETLLGTPHCPNTSYQTPMTGLLLYTGVPAGAHQIQVRWSTVSNTLKAHGDQRRLLVMEGRV